MTRKGTKQPKSWSSKEDKLLMKMYGKYTYDEIASKLGRTKRAVATRVRKFKDTGIIKRTEPKREYFSWDDSAIAALLEFRGTCTHAQIAKYLGCTKEAVDSRVQILLDSGVITKTEYGRKNPWMIPQNAILLAKTCIKCGELRDASRYASTKQGRSVRNECMSCCNARRDMDKVGKETRKKRDIWQQLSAENAQNHGMEWTSSELETISDNEKSNFQLAMVLGRTYNAVCSARIRAAVNPRKPEIGPWIIHFPKALKALKQEFIRLGVPDDWGVGE